jgi:dCTP deaminase
MILTGPEIRKRIANGSIEIDPFDDSQVNPNSVNLKLGNEFRTYALDWPHGPGLTARTMFNDPNFLDARLDNRTVTAYHGEEGILLKPGVLYLAHTVERTYTPDVVPMLEGRSSLARLGVCVHQTGGFGDVGFNGQWVLEISCIHPVRIYPGMAICQMVLFDAVGDLLPYRGRYQNQLGPVACRLWQDKK